MLRRLVLLIATASLVLAGSGAGSASASASGRPAFLLAEHPRVQYVLEGRPWRATGDLAGPGQRPYRVQARKVGPQGGTGAWRTIQAKRSRAGGGVSIQITQSQQGRYQMRAVAPRWHGQGRAISRTLLWLVIKQLNAR